jgi:predicted negative regulator of RcsB-dependent stress response
MKMISKIAKATLGLVFIGSSSVFAQSLADAKKAIDAEQYQKAKSMLKNLTVTQADKDENFFTWVGYTLNRIIPTLQKQHSIKVLL